MVLVTSPGVARALHVVPAFHVVFSEAVDYDVDVDVAGVVVAVEVGADDGLVSGEVPFCVFQAEGLRTFSGELSRGGVFGIEGDYVVVGLDLGVVLVFMVFLVEFPALHVEGGRVAVNARDMEGLAHDEVAVFVAKGLVAHFVVLEHEVLDGGLVVRAFAG